MPNYSNGKIYTIRFKDNDKLIYIGSTTQSLAVRFGGHKKQLKSSAGKISIYSFIEDTYNNDWSMCYIELYENHPCNNKEELHKKEGEIIREFLNNDSFNVINRYIAGRTIKEWHIDNKEYVQMKKKEYYENNKEIKKEYDKVYRKEHYERIQSNLKIYNNEKVQCDCGLMLNRSSLKRHIDTKKHKEFINKIE